MTDFRGYGRRQRYVQHFSDEVASQRVALTADELLAATYIDWDYWIELSGGPRRPGDAARTILVGRRAFDVPNDSFLALADALRKGSTFPEQNAEGQPKGTLALEGLIHRHEELHEASGSLPQMFHVAAGNAAPQPDGR
jgi:hypothetical protein